MSSKDSFLISNFEIGEQNNVKPFLLPEKAFDTLEDAFVFRGRVEKRFGFNLFSGGHLNSRLRILIGTTDGVGDLAATVPGAIYKIGQMFSIGTELFTVNATGNPAVMLTTGAATVHTYDTTTGAFVINGAAINTSVYFYPAEPVMGLRQRELANINFEETIAFDTQFSYRRQGLGWNVCGPIPPAAGSAIWTGSNSQFYWTCNWMGLTNADRAFFVVNYQRADQIKYLLLSAPYVWVTLRPQLNVGATRYLDSGKIIIPFKDRLLVLNTLETDGANQLAFRNRVRWSQNGEPLTAATSWLDDTVGRGGYLDADTSESIISAQFVKDRLIVYFESSTYELVYTGNEILPFRFQKINSELGCESTFSEIPFDDGVIGVGNRGIHVANISGVQRIDDAIPNFVSKIENLNQGHERVYGIRDYFREIAMWTYPYFISQDDDALSTTIFPNRVLVYNYKNNTWAFFRDRFTCYGYYQKTTGLTWDTLPYNTWDSWNTPWNSGMGQAQFPLIIAGNAQGWTFLFEDTGDNDPSIYINDFVGNTVFAIDHGLEQGQYIIITGLNGGTITDQVYQVESVPALDRFTISEAIVGVYTGGGQVEVLNRINIRTKEFNFYWNVNKEMSIDNILYLLDRTEEGEVTVNYYINGNKVVAIPSLFGSNVINTHFEPIDLFSADQEYIWHRDNRNIIANSVQVEITLSDIQMRDLTLQGADFILEALLFKSSPSGRL